LDHQSRQHGCGCADCLRDDRGDQLDHVTTLVQRAQAPLVQAQQAAPQVQALIRRTALGATRDAALKDLLAKHGISLTEKPADDATVNPAAVSNATPASTP
jgi:hypothetical protein